MRDQLQHSTPQEVEVEVHRFIGLMDNDGNASLDIDEVRVCICTLLIPVLVFVLYHVCL
jgi:hypothetical protein